MNADVNAEISDSASDVGYYFVCRECGHAHSPVSLRPGEMALCTQCNSVLVKKSWFGRDSTLAFACTGLLLFLPAISLPFVTVSKLGNEHSSLLFTGARVLWDDGHYLLSIWVLVCGCFAPIFLLLSLTGLLIQHRFSEKIEVKHLLPIARAVSHWAIPEVQVLAVLVALAKLGHVVHVSMGPGFWCYVALAVTTMLAWRGFVLDPPN